MATQDIHTLPSTPSNQLGLVPFRQRSLAMKHAREASATRGRMRVRTCARGRVWLPEKSVLDLHTSDFGLPLQSVSWIALEDDGVTCLFAVTTPAPVLGNSWVIAGSGSRN